MYHNSIQVEIQSRTKSGNASFHSVQNLLASILLSRNIKIKMYRTIILPVSYGCVTWSLTLRKESRLRVFENRPKRYDVRGEWRKLHNKELNHLYVSPNIVRVSKLRRIRWAGNVACMWVRRGPYGIW